MIDREASRSSKMNRRQFLTGTALVPFFPPLSLFPTPALAAQPPLQRPRPSDPRWPSADQWETLNRTVGGRLTKVETPLSACGEASDTQACAALFKELKNPYFIRDQVGVTQTLGWVDGWTFKPSAYAVAARQTSDVVAAVNFARDNNLRLVVKGGGHSYLGTSNAPDSLMIWTRFMDDITLHDDFVAQGCQDAPQPAVTVGAGAIWMHTYNAVTTKGGRYVQGGGCGTVGVAGLVQGGGFGSFSKNYGTAAASLLEAEIVTADGTLQIANACQNADLFWALKGGGGGTFGVVTRLTLRTHPLPEFFGGVFATVQATDDAAFRRLIGRFVQFYADHLHNAHWGEIVNLRRHHTFEISMTFQGITQQDAEAVWQPLFDWLNSQPSDYSFARAPQVIAVPARHLWDPDFLRTKVPQAILSDDRPGASPDNLFWSGNLAEAGHVLYGFQSVWLPATLLEAGRQEALADTLFAAAKLHPIELHFQKGLSGASDESSPRRGTPRPTPTCWMPSCLRSLPARDSRPIPGSLATSLTSATRARKRPKSIARCSRSRRSLPMRAPMSRKAITSSRTGSSPIGAATMRGCSSSSENTIPIVSSSSGTGSEAKAGATMALRS